MAGTAPHPEPPSVVLRSADPLAVLPLIEGISDLSYASTGAFIFGPQEHPEGTILIENGRVCWAAAVKMGHRLTNSLRKRLDEALGPSALEEIVHRCAAEGTPLGETLVAGGFLSSESLKEALRQHTSEAILFLSQRAGAPPTWVAHRKQRYDARFTFSPVELLASIGAVCLPDLASRATGEVEGLRRAGGSAVVFTWVGLSATLFPIHEVRGSGLTVRHAFELGSWATRMLSVQLQLGSMPRLVSAIGAKGDAVVGWISAGIVYVVICPNTASLEHVLSKRGASASGGGGAA